MFLYQDPDNRYIAVPPALVFSATNGFRACFDGKRVPPIICKAFIAEHGGYMVASD